MTFRVCGITFVRCIREKAAGALYIATSDLLRTAHQKIYIGVKELCSPTKSIMTTKNFPGGEAIRGFESILIDLRIRPCGKRQPIHLLIKKRYKILYVLSMTKLKLFRRP